MFDLGAVYKCEGQDKSVPRSLSWYPWGWAIFMPALAAFDFVDLSQEKQVCFVTELSKYLVQDLEKLDEGLREGWTSSDYCCPMIPSEPAGKR